MLEDRRKERLRFRSWHRGTREMDLILGRFADAYLPQFTPRQLDEYEQLLGYNDPDLYNWITAAQPVPDEQKLSVLDLLISFKPASFA